MPFGMIALDLPCVTRGASPPPRVELPCVRPEPQALHPLHSIAKAQQDMELQGQIACWQSAPTCPQTESSPSLGHTHMQMVAPRNYVNPCVAACYEGRGRPVLGVYKGACDADADAKCAMTVTDDSLVCVAREPAPQELPSTCYARTLVGASYSVVSWCACGTQNQVQNLQACAERACHLIGLLVSMPAICACMLAVCAYDALAMHARCVC